MNINDISNPTDLGVLPSPILDSEAHTGATNTNSNQPAQAQSDIPLQPSTKPSIASSMSPPNEKNRDSTVESPQSSLPHPPLRYKTMRTLLMGILISMGGLVFGYGGVGQIGGYLAMRDYRDRFGDVYDNERREYSFSNARAGAIVGLVRGSILTRT